MKIQRLFGVYVATQRNKKGGGWFASGKTRGEALQGVIKAMKV